jgi:hypothetical protein
VASSRDGPRQLSRHACESPLALDELAHGCVLIPADEQHELPFSDGIEAFDPRLELVVTLANL